MKPVVKVWCLPESTEEELRALFEKIVETLCPIKNLGINNQTDLVILFPQDMMRYGLGSEIIVEMADFCCGSANFKQVFKKATKSMVDILTELYPDAQIQCRLWRTENSYHSETQ